MFNYMRKDKVEVDTSTLNDEQSYIFKSIIENIENVLAGEQDDKVFSISGFAGSGKTYLTAKIIQELMFRGISSAVTTPTHKAVKVLKDMLKSNDIDIEDPSVSIGTIHHFLNLKLDYGFDKNDDDQDGKRVFSDKPKLVVNTFNECLEYVDILFVDEASMVSDELYRLAVSILGDRAKAIIYIGDEYQLLPIEKGDSSIFHKPEIMHFKLTKIVRQAEGSAIIKKSQELIRMIQTQQFPENLNELFTEQENGIKITDYNGMYEMYFKDENDKVVGCFTNKRVDDFNDYLRHTVLNMLHETNNEIKPYLCLDDVLIFQAPYTDSKGNVLFNNGEVVDLEGLKLIDDPVHGWKVWKAKIEGIFVYILDVSSIINYNSLLESYKEVAKISKGYDRKKDWKKYFKLVGKYGKVKYDYASTLHKLQGSTYTHIYFDLLDLNPFYERGKEMMIRLCYVAITRASEQVIVIKQKGTYNE